MPTTGVEMKPEAAPTLEQQAQDLSETLGAAHHHLNDIMGTPPAAESGPDRPGLGPTMSECLVQARDLRDRIRSLVGQLGTL